MLVQLLGECGLETGFKSVHGEMNVETGKGLEFITGKATRRAHRSNWNSGALDCSPQVIKEPFGLGRPYDMFDWVDYFDWKVDHVFLTARHPLKWIEAVRRYHSKHDQPRAIYKSERNPEWEICFIWLKVYCEIMRRGFPLTVIEFPRVVMEAQLCYDLLQPVIDVEYQKFKELHAKVVNPNMVHVK
jgi:hypothetical protein